MRAEEPFFKQDIRSRDAIHSPERFIEPVVPAVSRPEFASALAGAVERNSFSLVQEKTGGDVEMKTGRGECTTGKAVRQQILRTEVPTIMTENPKMLPAVRGSSVSTGCSQQELHSLQSFSRSTGESPTVAPMMASPHLPPSCSSSRTYRSRFHPRKQSKPVQGTTDDLVGMIVGFDGAKGVNPEAAGRDQGTCGRHVPRDEVLPPPAADHILTIQDVEESLLSDARLRLFWPADKRWYCARIEEIDFESNAVLLVYETGETEQMSCAKFQSVVRRGHAAWTTREDAELAQRQRLLHSKTSEEAGKTALGAGAAARHSALTKRRAARQSKQQSNATRSPQRHATPPASPRRSAASPRPPASPVRRPASPKAASPKPTKLTSPPARVQGSPQACVGGPTEAVAMSRGVAAMVHPEFRQAMPERKLAASELSSRKRTLAVMRAAGPAVAPVSWPEPAPMSQPMLLPIRCPPATVPEHLPKRSRQHVVMQPMDVALGAVSPTAASPVGLLEQEAVRAAPQQLLQSYHPASPQFHAAHLSMASTSGGLGLRGGMGQPDVQPQLYAVPGGLDSSGRRQMVLAYHYQQPAGEHCGPAQPLPANLLHWTGRMAGSAPVLVCDVTRGR